MYEIVKLYRSSIVLLMSIAIGGWLGIYYPSFAEDLKPLGEIFLNLLFVTITPMVAVGVMSSIAKVRDSKELKKILFINMSVSVSMSILAALVMLSLVFFYNPAEGVVVDLENEIAVGAGNIDVVNILTTNDFSNLLSKSYIMPLLVMSILVGFAISRSGEKGRVVANLLDCCNVVIGNLIGIIMKVAPIGLSAFFASIVASLDSNLLATFISSIILFLISTVIYLSLGSTLFAYFGNGKQGIKSFWANVFSPAVTALGTCSSLASLPSTMVAAKNMGIKEDIVDVCLPLLMNINKAGIAMNAVLKVTFICFSFGLSFDLNVLMLTMLIAILSPIIVGGVPSGGFIGSMFIFHTLDLPVEAIPMLIVLTTVTDAPATVINVVNNLAAIHIVNRFSSKVNRQLGC